MTYSREFPYPFTRNLLVLFAYICIRHYSSWCVQYKLGPYIGYRLHSRTDALKFPDQCDRCQKRGLLSCFCFACLFVCQVVREAKEMSEALGIPLCRAGDTVPIDMSFISNRNQSDDPGDGMWEAWNSHGYDLSAGIAADANASPKVMGLSQLCDCHALR